MSKPNAVIAYVHPLMVNAHFMGSVINAVRKYDYPIIPVMSGPNVSKARNLICETFLKRDEEWLFMVDTDMVFSVDTIENLIACKNELVSGLCMTGGEKPSPSMYRRIYEGADKGQYVSINEWPTDELIDADVVGSACTLIHRNVLEDIRRNWPNPAAHWYQELQVGDVLVGEDFTFCERASRAGYQVKVATDIQVGHIKGTMIGEVKLP